MKRGLIVGVLGMLALQALLALGLLSTQSYDPIIVNPDKDLGQDGISMLCSDSSRAGLTPQGRHSEVLSSMPPMEIGAPAVGAGPYGKAATSGTITTLYTTRTHTKLA